MLAFVPRWVEELAARYNAFGPEALGDRRRRNGRARQPAHPGPARRPGRAREGAARGRRAAGAAPRSPRLDGAARLGLARVHPQRGWEALKRIGWSIQAPRPRHARAATPEARAAFKGGSMPLSLGPGRRTLALAGRGLGRGRAPPRPEAGPPPRLGAHRRAPGRARPPPLSSGCTSPPSCSRPRGEAVWFLSTGPEQAASSKRCSPPSRGGPARGASGTSSSCSTTPAGTARGLGRARRASRLVFLPPYSPELQPAERLWPLVDEPVANRHFATLADLDAVVAERCRRLDAASHQAAHRTSTGGPSRTSRADQPDFVPRRETSLALSTARLPRLSAPRFMAFTSGEDEDERLRDVPAGPRLSARQGSAAAARWRRAGRAPSAPGRSRRTPRTARARSRTPRRSAPASHRAAPARPPPSTPRRSR